VFAPAAAARAVPTLSPVSTHCLRFIHFLHCLHFHSFSALSAFSFIFCIVCIFIHFLAQGPLYGERSEFALGTVSAPRESGLPHRTRDSVSFDWVHSCDTSAKVRAERGVLVRGRHCSRPALSAAAELVRGGQVWNDKELKGDVVRGRKAPRPPQPDRAPVLRCGRTSTRALRRDVSV
jgi:hypothetical protein